jgi:hypothetical protein
VGVQGGGFERPDQGFAGFGRVNDGVYPQASGGVAWVGLMVIGSARGLVERLLFLFVYFFAFAFELLEL